MYLLKAHFQVSCPILVCAPTNAAVDNLVGTLRRKSLKVLRMGRPMRIREDCQANSYDAVQERHPLFKEMGLLKTQLEEALDKLRRLGFRSAAPQEVARKINPLNETAVCELVLCKPRALLVDCSYSGPRQDYS